MKKELKKIIISGGGTGGHVFPAITIADTIKKRYPEVEILFIGADNRLEMEKVPQAGYKIIGLPIKALPRKISFSIFDTTFRLLKSIRMSKKIIKDFKPDAVVGVGGYASGAVMYVSTRKRIPTLVQEQNSFAGITNKLVAKKVNAICVAYDGMEKFFPAEKIHITGNPIRNLDINIDKNEACEYFGLKAYKKTIFVTGGSLGAKTLNNSIIKNFDKIKDSGVQLLWQTGKFYFEEVKKFFDSQINTENIKILPFVDKMDFAFKCADLVISRAGAISISELALLKKAVIFVPSPNVAEDHQTKNAQALLKINAALMVADNEAENILIDKALHLISQNEQLSMLSENIFKYAKPNAANEIVDILENML